MLNIRYSVTLNKILICKILEADPVSRCKINQTELVHTCSHTYKITLKKCEENMLHLYKFGNSVAPLCAMPLLKG